MNLITGTIVDTFTGAFGDLFDSMVRARRFITVFKEPQKVLISTQSNDFAGYENPQDLTAYQYIPISGVYPAHILYDYKDDALDQYNSEINMRIINKPLRIKVEENAKDFILNGKTENILIDGQTYNDFSQYKVQNYLGLVYYYFELKQTK